MTTPKISEVKVSEYTDSPSELDDFLKEGWILLGTEEFLTGDEPRLKKTKYVLGHTEKGKLAPTHIIECRKIIAKALVGR